MIGGRLWALNYAQLCAMQVDTVEKKPLYHFLPGARTLSVGTFGCNLECAFCQNNQLALPEGDVPADTVSPESLVGLAKAKGAEVIAFTFNEPSVWAEYIIDVSAHARASGFRLMVNSNGYIHGRARRDLLNAIDAIKVDIKAFSDEGYSRLCGGELQPVLETCRVAQELGKHLEVAYPLISGENDSPVEIAALGEFLARELGVDVPVHLFRFHPFYRMSSAPETKIEQMEKARAVLLREGMRYIYFGGTVGGIHQDTSCPDCGTLLVKRSVKEEGEKVFVKNSEVSRFCPSFAEARSYLREDRCPHCNSRIYGIWRK
jgi:pyruvate formate lyase activating enzyme